MASSKTSCATEVLLRPGPRRRLFPSGQPADEGQLKQRVSRERRSGFESHGSQKRTDEVGVLFGETLRKNSMNSAGVVLVVFGAVHHRGFLFAERGGGLIVIYRA